MASNVRSENIDFSMLLKLWNDHYKDATPQQPKTESIVQKNIPKHLSSSIHPPPTKPLPPLPPLKKSISAPSMFTLRSRSKSSPVRPVEKPKSSSSPASSPLQRKESNTQIDPKEAIKDKVEKSYKKIIPLIFQQKELILLTQSKNLDASTMLNIYQTQEKIITQVKEGNHLIYENLEKSCLLDPDYSKKAKLRDNRFEDCMGKITDFLFEMKELQKVLKDSTNILVVGTNSSPQKEIADALTTFFSQVMGELLLNQFVLWKTSYIYDASFNEEIMTNLSHYFNCVFTLIEIYIKHIVGGSISIKNKKKEEIRIEIYDYLGRKQGKEVRDVMCLIPREISQYKAIFNELIITEESLIEWRKSHGFPFQIEEVLKNKFKELGVNIDTLQSKLNDLLK